MVLGDFELLRWRNKLEVKIEMLFLVYLYKCGNDGGNKLEWLGLG